MGVFDDVKLSWQDKTYTIPANRVLGAIASIEEVITLAELGGGMSSGKVPAAKLAMAYGAVLRYAGAEVNDDEVYGGLFPTGNNAKLMASALTALLALMLPPDARTPNSGDGESPPPGPRRTRAGSSRRPIKRWSSTGA